MASVEPPNWGVELWDQYDKISSHTQNGVQFLENFHAFIKERAVIETEYADKLRKMARKYQPKKARQGQVEEEDTNFTTHLAFNSMLNEIADLAGQHEVISEVLVQNIAKEIASLVRELKDERKRLLAEGSKLQQNLQNCVGQMEKCQRAYVKAHRDAEKMQEKYERAEKDMHLSRAEVEIAKQSSIAKNQFCEESKTEYASQLQKTNELQRMHFNEYMPRVFSDLQQMDERRITCIQNFMKEVALSQLKVNPIITKCLNEIIASAERVDPVKDSEMVVDKYKTGFFPPDDFPFENLSEEKPNGASLNYGPGSGGSHHKDKTQRGTMSSKSGKKRGLLANIFGPSNKNNLEDAKEETWSELPPNQRRKKIQKKLNEIRDELAHETNQKDGLQKMRRTYEENPALGDPASVEPESERCNKRIDSLHQQVQRYQSLLNEIESSTPDAVKRSSGHTRGNSITSAEDTGSLSRSNSDESNIHNNSGTHHPTQHPLHHGHPHSIKGHRSKHITCSSSSINTSNGHHHLGGALNGHTAGAATNGHASNSGMPRNRSSSSSSANSSNPATPLTPNTPHTPLSPLTSLNNPPTSSSYCPSINTPTSPGSVHSDGHGMSADSHNGLSSAAGGGGGISATTSSPLCNSGNGGGPLSPSNLTGGHNIPPIEEEVYATIPGGGSGYTGSSNGDHGAFNSESGVGSGSLRDIDDPDFDRSAKDKDGEDKPLPLLGTAIALYTFEPQNEEGAIFINENDKMYIVELDQGDGWTRVRMQRDSEEGFVPSSYIDITMYNTC